MLSNSNILSVICTSRFGEAEAFYRDTLGLRPGGCPDGARVFHAGSGELRLAPVASTAASEHTVLGFAVDDVDAAIAGLVARGVCFERFPGFRHAANGSVRTPDGARVAWFRDPDGNLLSVVQPAGVGVSARHGQ